MDALVWKAGFLTQVGLQSANFDEIQQLLNNALSTCAEAIELNVDQSLPRQQAAQILELKEQFGKWVST